MADWAVISNIVVAFATLTMAYVAFKQVIVSRKSIEMNVKLRLFEKHTEELKWVFKEWKNVFTSTSTSIDDIFPKISSELDNKKWIDGCVKVHAKTLVEKLKDFKQKWEERKELFDKLLGEVKEKLSCKIRGSISGEPIKIEMLPEVVCDLAIMVAQGSDPSHRVEKWSWKIETMGEHACIWFGGKCLVKVPRERGEEVKNILRNILSDLNTYEPVLGIARSYNEYGEKLNELRKEIVSELNSILARPTFMEECVKVKEALEGLKKGVILCSTPALRAFRRKRGGN